MALLNWMGEHPILTVILAFIVAITIIDAAGAIAKGMAAKNTCTCKCSKPDDYSKEPK